MPRGRVATVLKVLAAVGAFAVIAGAFLVYLFTTTAIASSQARSDSVALLETVRTRANNSDVALQKLPTFAISSTNPDYATAKQTADQYATQLTTNRTGVQADEARLGTDRDRLQNQAGGVLALPFRPGLDRERTRTEGMLSALQAEDAGLGIEVDQMKAVSAIFDAEGTLYDLVVNHLGNQDIPGTLALFPTLDAKLATAATAASGQNVPPQAHQLVVNMQTLSTDLHAFVQAYQRDDLDTLVSLQPKIDADTTALENFDSQGLDTYEQNLLQPYQDQFNAGFRAAGFSPATLT
jgi:hypothetical protein